MAKINGTPWHIEVLGDGERHYRSVCRFYDKETGYCSKKNSACYSPSRCTDYKRLSDEEIKERDKHLRSKGYTGKPKRKPHKEEFWFIHEDPKDESVGKAKPRRKTSSDSSRRAKEYVPKPLKDTGLPPEYRVGARVSISAYKRGEIVRIEKNRIFIKLDNGETVVSLYPFCEKEIIFIK